MAYKSIRDTYEFTALTVEGVEQLHRDLKPTLGEKDHRLFQHLVTVIHRDKHLYTLWNNIKVVLTKHDLDKITLVAGSRSSEVDIRFDGGDSAVDDYLRRGWLVWMQDKLISAWHNIPNLVKTAIAGALVDMGLKAIGWKK